MEEWQQERSEGWMLMLQMRRVLSRRRERSEEMDVDVIDEAGVKRVLSRRRKRSEQIVLN